MTASTPRSCLVCDGRPVTKQHLWPHWIGEAGLAPEGRHRVITQQVRNREPARTRAWSGVAFDQTVKAVCAPCNNGWMSDVENAVRQTLGTMLGGCGIELHQTRQRDLAAWATLAAIMFDGSVNGDDRTFPVEDLHYLHEHRQPPDHLRIWLTTCDATLTGTVDRFGADIDTSQDDTRGVRDLYGVTFTVGPVVLQVLGSRVTTYFDRWRYAYPRVHRLWPYEGSFTWTTTPSMSLAELTEFREMLPRRLSSTPIGVTYRAGI